MNTPANSSPEDIPNPEKRHDFETLLGSIIRIGTRQKFLEHTEEETPRKEKEAS